ncbi:nickel/cobalt transporter [Affinibrenneria salicis]|uniref:Nickel/cobalt efflux system n=1 Tax=Affinibrenneria salicis TaxID=2590031 RepID=A0A5J5FT54_9GAMM|nr:nickel/cobalt transporter [Affinibrenneria salicis]KAA8995717.1 nickel/cobalt transporter [Affinibrenneria salicis]
MSLNLTAPSRRNRRGLLGLWPLLIFVLLLAALIPPAIGFWPQVQLKSIIWQREFHQQMAALLQLVKAQPHQAGLSLLFFSLAYGVLHALGPGHGKVVIATWLATHPSRLKSSLQLTLAASLLQGTVAIALVTLVLTVLHLSSRTLHGSSFWLEKGSFILVAALGAWLCLRALRRIVRVVRSLRRRPTPPAIQRLRPMSQTPSLLRAPGHQRDAAGDLVCGCGHRHQPAPDALERDEGWRTRLMIIVSMGIRPCSGAIMVLLFSKVIGVFGWGAAAALVMSCGTALTISLLAVLVFYSRRLAVRLSRRRAPALWQQVAGASLALAGGLFLLCVGIVLYLSAQPVIGGGIRPFTG